MAANQVCGFAVIGGVARVGIQVPAEGRGQFASDEDMRAIRTVLALCLSLGWLAVIGTDQASAQNIYYLNPQWVPYGGGPLPPPVISGGFEHGHSFPICRAFAVGFQIPGKFLDGRCNVSYGGNGFAVNPPFEVLVGQHYPGVNFWIRNMAPDMTNIVPAGTDSGQTVGVCVGYRADGTAHAGKLFDGSCYFEYGGHEERVSNFEWLAAHTYP